MEFSCGFDLEIKHVKWKENKVTYALRKKFHVESINVYKIYLKEKALESLDSD